MTAAVEAGDTYEALQAGLALLSRAKCPADALKSAITPVRALSACGAVKEAAELFQAAVGSKTKLDDEGVALLPAAVDALCGEVDFSAVEESVATVVIRALDVCVAAGAHVAGRDGFADLLPKIHLKAARVSRQAGHASTAISHFLRAGAPDEFSEFAVSQAASCSPSERPVVLVRTCLQLLSIGSYRDAVRFLDALAARGVAPTEDAAFAASMAAAEGGAAPEACECACRGVLWRGASLSCLNATRLLLRACSRGRAAADVMLAVRERYSPVLDAVGGADVDDGELGSLFDAAVRTFSRTE